MISRRRRLHRVLLLGHHHDRVTRDRTTWDYHLSHAMHAELLRAVGLEGEAVRADPRALILARSQPSAASSSDGSRRQSTRLRDAAHAARHANPHSFGGSRKRCKHAIGAVAPATRPALQTGDAAVANAVIRR